jgi:hypothetical protein
MGAIGNVQQSLGRRGEYERLSRLGMPAARELVGQVAPNMPSAGMFNPKYSVLKAIVNRIQGKVEGKAMGEMAEVLRDPQKVAEMMEKATAAERRQLVNLLSDQTVRSAIISSTQ